MISSICLPLVLSIFKKFWDRGYVFSKILSLVVLTYSVFVLGVIKLLPFTNLSIWFLILIFLSLNGLYLSRPKRFKAFTGLIKENWKKFLFEEILFLLILIVWSFVRGFNPAIEGLEKFMDWGFVNSMLRSVYMPPVDMWFANEPINYYYFGHLIFALVTKLSNINSTITYNLSIASIAALTFVSTFSLSLNLVYCLLKKSSLAKLILAGTVSALLLTFGGNLHAVYKIGRINMDNNQGKLVLNAGEIQKAASGYWYPDATRFIGFDPETSDKTIHEFPIYSFVVADLHGHLNDIPLVLFFLAFLFSVSLLPKQFSSWKLLIPAGFLLSIAYMTNAWDIAVYGLFFGLYVFLYKLRQYNFRDSLVKTLFNGFLVILFWYLFTLPFSLNFTPMMEGLRLSDAHSPFYQLFILYGGFWLIALPFVIFFFVKNKLNIKKATLSDVFVLSLLILATLLIIMPEVFYIKDIYIYEHRRANTMFKLVYQAFILYSLASGYILVRLKLSLKRVLFGIYALVFSLVFISHLIYPYFATKSYYSFKEYHGLWGLDFLEDKYPDNYAAIKWLNANVEGQPNIIEAAGDSYTTYNQVSMATGLPTVQGWLVHEWLWRGGYDQPGARAEEVKTVYESTDIEKVKPILQKYSVKYIFIGDKEYEKYPQLNTQKFEEIGANIVFESGKTKIFQL